MIPRRLGRYPRKKTWKPSRLYIFRAASAIPRYWPVVLSDNLVFRTWKTIHKKYHRLKYKKRKVRENKRKKNFRLFHSIQFYLNRTNKYTSNSRELGEYWPLAGKLTSEICNQRKIRPRNVHTYQGRAWNRHEYIVLAVRMPWIWLLIRVQFS